MDVKHSTPVRLPAGNPKVSRRVSHFFPHALLAGLHPRIVTSGLQLLHSPERWSRFYADYAVERTAGLSESAGSNAAAMATPPEI
jgi:hypothetical protein